MNISYNECKTRDLHNMTEWCPGCMTCPKIGNVAYCDNCHTLVVRPVACDECEAKLVDDYMAHSNARASKIVADHGVTDKKGRAVGGIAYIRPHYHQVSIVGQAKSGSLWLGEWALYTHATRDGKVFGSGGVTKAYDTREAAEKAAHAALARQAKRYHKEFSDANLAYFHARQAKKR